MKEQQANNRSWIERHYVVAIATLAILAVGITVAIILLLVIPRGEGKVSDDGVKEEEAVVAEEFPEETMNEVKDVDTAEDSAGKAREYIAKHLELIKSNETAPEDKLRSVERLVWLCGISRDCEANMSTIVNVGKSSDFSAQQRERYYFAVDSIYGFTEDIEGRLVNLKEFIDFLSSEGRDDEEIDLYRKQYDNLAEELNNV